MRTLRRPTVLLLLAVFLASPGCSSTAGLRTGAAPKIRTIASVGDKPLPAEAGEPGSSVAADEYTPERRVNKDGRVSGRVFDEKGDPVPNARVRLALGATSGGKVLSTTTDRSGAFSLNGLRPGATYTLIAEAKDQEFGALSGRTEARAPETGVRINLVANEESAPPARASGGVNTVSRPKRHEPGDEEESDDGEATGTIPGELLPPAPEAETFLPSKGRRGRGAVQAPDGEPPMTARWRRGEADRPASTARAETPPAGADDPPSDEVYDDDGQNPLPPALEPGEAGPPDRTSGDLRRTRSKPARELEKEAPGSRVIVPETFVPIALAEKSGPTGPPPEAIVSPPAETKRRNGAQPPPAVPWYEGPSASEDRPAPRVTAEESALVTTDEESTPQGPRKRKTWGELTTGLPSEPRPQENAGPPVEPLPAVEGETRLVSAGREASPPRAQPAADAPAADDRLAYCRFDAKTRRIVDFRLPDVNGKPVRLQDLDTDLVLIDFWGTWCKPCVNSIPHLVDLQKRLGGKRVTVLGIASEQGPPAARVASVNKAIQKLGINYPILMSGMDGENCPVQEALHIQAFPTLILVDRQGRVLWRDQGATPATLAKLDNLIASSKNSDDVRRY